MADAVFYKDEWVDLSGGVLSLDDVTVINSIVQEVFGEGEEQLQNPAITISDGEMSHDASIHNVVTKIEALRNEKINIDSLQIKLSGLGREIEYKSVGVHFYFRQDEVRVRVEVYAKGDNAVKVQHWGSGFYERLVNFLQKDKKNAPKGLIIDKTGMIIESDENNEHVVQKKIINQQIINTESIAHSNISHSGNISIKPEEKRSMWEKASWIVAIIAGIVTILVALESIL